MGKKKDRPATLGTPKRILVAPLDWGLGHATRCIPLIRLLQQQGHEVFLAGEGPVQHLLQAEFPQLPFLPLPGYGVQYAKKGRSLSVALLLQVPKILKAISSEQQWLHNLQPRYRFDAVLSDNRYGLHHPDTSPVFITHQLCIKAPFSLAEKALQQINYRFIKQFSECWVPDYKEGAGLAGILSHPQIMPPLPVRYIGPLSRFSGSAGSHQKKHLLVLLSGPEPQRSLLEKLLLEQLAAYASPVVFVRGLPGPARHLPVAANIHLVNHLPAASLQRAIQEAFFVIARSGYSTVMDLMALQQKSILIPTPGQTEQEYLAKHLMQQQYAFCVAQKSFHLQTALKEAASFPYRFPALDEGNALKQAVAGWLMQLQGVAAHSA